MHTSTRLLVPVLACGAFLAAAPPAGAENFGRWSQPHEQLTTYIAPAADADDFVFDAGAGWKVIAKVKRTKASEIPGDEPLPNDVAPVVELLDPDGAVLTEGVKSRASKKTASVKATLPEGGRWALRIRGASGTGEVVLKWKVKPAKIAKVKNQDLLPDSITEFPFSATGGALVSWKLKFKGDGAAQVKAVLDPEGVDAGFDPQDEDIVLRKGTREKVKDFPLPEDGPGGDWKLVVDNSLFSSTMSLTVKVKMPKRDRVSPALTPEEPVLTGLSSIVGGCGSPVTLTGENLGTAPQGILFGDRFAYDVDAPDGKTAFCRVPGGTGTVSVSYIAADGQVAFLADAYTFAAPPVITSMDPTTGPNVGGVELTITGTGFIAAAADLYTVLFKENPDDISGVAGSQVRVGEDGDTITCLTPAHVSGSKTVVVRNACGEEVVAPETFDYATGLYITIIRPSAVPAFGGVEVAVYGANFEATDQVLLDGVPVDTTPIIYNTNIIGHLIDAADLPSHAPGGVDVTVESETNASNTKVDGLSYFAFTDITSTVIPAPPSGDDWGGVSSALGFQEGDSVVDWIVLAHPTPISSSRPGTRILLNDGTGAFEDNTATGMPAVEADQDGRGWSANCVASGRLNSDGHSDLYLSRTGTGVAWDKPPKDSVTDWLEARLIEPGNKYIDPWGTLLFGNEEGGFDAQVIKGDVGLLNIAGIIVCNATWACAGEKRQQGTVCKLFDFDYRSTGCTMGDLDGDFDQDIVLLNDHSLADFKGTSIGTWVSCYGYGTVDYQYYETNPDGSCMRILTTGSNGGLTDRTEEFLTDESSADENFTGVSAFVADVDGDFLNDIVIVHNDEITAGATRVAAARIFLQKNSGSTVTFTQNKSFFPAPLSVGDDDWRGDAIAAADLNNDFYRDIIVSVNGPPPTGSNFSTRILVQNPITKKVIDRTDAILTGVLPAGDDGRAQCIVAKDIDKDGDIDLVLSTPDSTGSGNPRTRFLLNLGPDPDTGYPRLLDATELFPDPLDDAGNAVSVQVGDLTGDGFPDLVLTDTHEGGSSTSRTRVWKQVR